MTETLLVGTALTREGAVGTLYRSVDGGDWELAEGIPRDTGVQAITALPDKEGVIFVATRSGVYKSTDDGANWKKCPVPADDNEEFWSISYRPGNTDVLFAGAAPVSVFKSEDCGASWRRVAGPFPEICDYSGSKGATCSRLMRTCADPNNTDLMFGACETNGVIMSEDGGENWRDISDTLIQMCREGGEDMKSAIITPNEEEGILDGHAVVISPDQPGVCILACRMGVFSTADKGETWHNHEVHKFAPIRYSRDLRVAIDDPQTLYLSLSIGARSEHGEFYRSTDLGKTWRRLDNEMNAESTIMGHGISEVNPNNLIYVTRHGQVHWSENRGESWNARQLPENAGDAFCSAIL